jgi:esterase
MLNYITTGTGNPVIWLHGLFGNCLTFSSMSKSIRAKNYLLESRNHGKSFHAKGMDYKTQALDLLNFMDGQKIPKASLIGHSMGGKTAMAFSCLYPERTEKLCVIDIAPIRYLEVQKQYYDNLKKLLEFIKHENISNKTRKEIKDSIMLRFNDVKIYNMISPILKGANKEFIWKIGIDNIIDSVEEISDWENFVGTFNSPTLVIAE